MWAKPTLRRKHEFQLGALIICPSEYDPSWPSIGSKIVASQKYLGPLSAL